MFLKGQWSLCRTAVFGLVWVAVVLSGFAFAGKAEANPKYASIVVDAKSGAVLRSRRADRVLHPASLTKMMTLYLVFEAERDGRLSFSQRIKVSRAAAAQPRSKLGLRAGSTITVKEAVRAAALKSANDMAVVLAEAVAGSEAAFARRMTVTARRLGMRNTTFKNASGLTARGHKSTARDMAILARALRTHFSRHYALFSEKKGSWGNIHYQSTNKFIRNYPGATGLKTGYTRAAGYNLAATAQRNGRELIGIVLGGKSSRTRDAHMAVIMNEGFRRSPPKNATVVGKVPPVPTRKPDDLPRLVSSLPLGSPEGWRASYETSSAEAANWAVQLGAYPQQPQAMRQLTQVLNSGLISDAPEAEPLILTSRNGSRHVYRARIAQLSRDRAEQFCAMLRARRVECVSIPPQSW